MSESGYMLNVRLNDAQAKILQQYAKQHDATISEVVRAAIERLTGIKG